MRLRSWLRSLLERWLTRHWWRTDGRLGLSTLPLYGLSLVYLLLWLARRWTARRPEPLPVPVIVVGNVVVGGAGKTPTVIALVQALQARGRKPGVISRGYGRRGSAPASVQAGSAVRDVGDEPVLIHRRTGAPVWVGQARRDVALALLAQHPEVDVIVSDDGMQHLGLLRDVDLLVFDERGQGNGLLLPAGPLRAPVPAAVELTRGTRVLYTAGVASTRLPGALATRRLGRAWPLQAWHVGDAAQAQDLLALQGRPLLAIAGLGAPEKFFEMLRSAGLAIQALPLPDHHDYATLPWPAGTLDVVTTEKDAVKLDPQRVGATRVWVVPLDLDIPSAFLDEVLALVPRTVPRTLPHTEPLAPTPP